MNYVFDYGELLLCVGPVFLMIALIFGALLWNSLPSKTKKDNNPIRNETNGDQK